VIRLLTDSGDSVGLVNSGLRKEDLEKVTRNFQKPYGMLLTTGPTGSGKTTISNLLARFYDPTSGSITIDGTDLQQDYGPFYVRIRISLWLEKFVIKKQQILQLVRQ